MVDTTSDAPVYDEYAQKLVEEREREEILASIPATAENRDELLQEQLVQRAEQRAAALGGEPEYVSEHDGAEFFTEAALEAHDASFFPKPPKRGGRKVQPVPVQVIDAPADVAPGEAVDAVPVAPADAASHEEF